MTSALGVLYLLYLCALLPVHSRSLRFTSGTAPGDLLHGSKAISSTYLHTGIGGARVKDQVGRCLTACDKGRRSTD